MQPVAVAFLDAERIGFSILWRISCGATPIEVRPTENFCMFQYSLANLVWCNTVTAVMRYALTRFSILWRISCGATPIYVPPNMACISFSILWRISCGATRGRRLGAGPRNGVSVFSGESRVVQPNHERTNN